MPCIQARAATPGPTDRCCLPLQIKESDLDAFVADSDRLGGPGSPACEAWWAGFSYIPTLQVDQSLDPFSEAYVDQQLALHVEMSGKAFDQAVNELAPFALEPHIQAVNPYNHPNPAELAMHVQRLSKAFRLAGVKLDDHLLDMGCGWGLSSEVAAYLGLRVTAVDINPNFVALVNARAERSGWRIKAVQSAFDDYKPVGGHDAVLFYECLHHAVRPWTLLQTMANNLSLPDGRLILAGEPFNTAWWKHWGLRLDALSVYCIRKFGWFESGWSLEFMEAVFARVGLRCEVHTDPDGVIGYTFIGIPARGVRQRMPDILAETPHENLPREQDAALLSGEGWFEAPFPEGSDRAWLEIANYRGKPITAIVRNGKIVVFKGEMSPGENRILLERRPGLNRIEIEAETWSPSEELGLPDDRHLSLHLTGIVFG